MKTLHFKINGKKYSIPDDIPEDIPLLWLIRDILQLKGTKFGCGKGLCGSCTVLVNGEAYRSCQLKLDSLKNSDSLETIEGVKESPLSSALIEAFIKKNVPQCGYCQVGQIMSATALLKANPKISDEDIKDEMYSNLCRCGTYLRIFEAIKEVRDYL